MLRLNVSLELSDTELEAALRFMARTTTLRLFGSAIDLTVLLLDNVKVYPYNVIERVSRVPLLLSRYGIRIALDSPV
jgi:hypothetical protein